MKLFRLKRTAELELATAGMLLAENSEILCRTLEPAKVVHNDHPRIPPGEYDLKIVRGLTASRFNLPYQDIFGKDFEGVIEIANVPGRSHVLFHMGNWFDQTLGCVICGRNVIMTESRKSFEVPGGESRPGYWAAYRPMLEAIKNGGAKLHVYDPTASAQPALIS